MLSALPTYRKIGTKTARFLGRQVVIYLASGVAVGLALFVVELGFAYGLQGFLIALGVYSPISMPRWVPYQNLRLILIFIFLVGASRAFLQWAQVYLAGMIIEEFKYLQRSRLIHWAFHSNSVNSSELSTLFNERTSVISGTLATLQNAIIKITSSLFVGLALFWISPVITVLASLSLLLVVIPLKLAEKRIRHAGDAVAEVWTKINDHLHLNIKNLLLMQIYGTQDKEEALSQERMRYYRRHAIEFTRISGIVGAAPQFIGVLLICIITAIAKKSNAIPTASLISYFYLFFRLLQAVSSVSLDITSILHSWPQLSSLAKWWADHAHDGVRKQRTTEPIEVTQLPIYGPVGWKLSDIVFSYTENQEKLINGLNLHIPPGETLVITGASGSGKTTLLNILLGGLEPQKGKVEIYGDGLQDTPLSKIRTSLLQEIGYVGPESFLTEGTVRENILYGVSAHIRDEEITDALNKSECQFIFTHAAGLEHKLTEQGQGLSAGQKQRLSLARALLRKPKALVLDEPTANLDSETEAKLIETLRTLKKSMTIIIISHRAELLQLADKKLRLG